MRTTWGAAVIAVVVLVAALLQTAVLTTLAIPAATPELVVVAVAAVALVRGPRVGAIAGFAAGLLLDLAPPAAHPVGMLAVVLAVAGHLAGTLTRPGAAPVAPLVRVAGVAALGAGTTLVSTVGTALLGGSWPTASGLAVATGASAVYAALAALLLTSGVGWLVRRTTPPPRSAW